MCLNSECFCDFLETVLVTGRSSTGFVTFTELGVVTSAVNSPLSHDPEILIVDVAPEPLDVVWKNVEVDLKQIEAKQNSARVIVAIGALFWSIPIAAIQFLANSKALGKRGESSIALVNCPFRLPGTYLT